MKPSVRSGSRRTAAGLILISATLATVQSGFAVLSARWLGPSDRGVYTIGVSIASFSLLLGSAGVFTGGRVLLSDQGAGFTWRDYRKVVVVLTGVQILLAVGINIPTWYVLSKVHETSAMLALGGYCITITAASLAREGIHGVGRHISAAVSDVLAAFVQLGLGLAVYAADRVDVATLISCGAAGFLVQIMFCGLRAPRTDETMFRLRGSVRLTVAVVRFSAPSLVLATGQLFIQKGDRVLLGIFASPSDVGVYAAAATIADTAWILPTSLSVMVLRSVAQTRSLRSLAKWRIGILTASAGAAGLLAVLSGEIIHLLLGDLYAGATHMVWLLCIGSVLFASQQVDLAACNGAGLLRHGARVTAWGMVSLLVLSLALMPALKAYGAIYASLGSYACMAAMARVAIHRAKSELLKDRHLDTLASSVEATITEGDRRRVRRGRMRDSFQKPQ